MSVLRVILVLLLLVVTLAIGAVAWAMRHPELEPIAWPETSSFDSVLVERGRSMVNIGNCVDCHTRQGGEPFAGGRALPTDFGTLYSTNITPDPETGIGAWSEEAFLRAMDQGVDREGNHLYPAFPYDRFTKVSEEDLRAIYAFLMSEVQPVSYEAPESELPFPFNIRPLLAGWKALFLDRGEWQPDPDQDEEWNRGSYLVEGIAHCGACHSPRNIFGAEEGGDNAYGGGLVYGWIAPALNENSPAPTPWTQIALVNYLLDGWDEDHGIAAGPMTPVVNNLYNESEDDAFAIAAYIRSLMGGPLDEEEQQAREEEVRAFAEQVEWGHPDNPPLPDDPLLKLGAEVFEAQCADCHRSGGEPAPLAMATSVNLPEPYNVIRATLYGIEPPQGSLGRSMPGRDAQIDDEQFVALLTFIRYRFSNEPPWEDLEEKLRSVRHSDAE